MMTNLIQSLYNIVIYFIKKLDKRRAKRQPDETEKGRLTKPPRL